ncbi:MAG: HPP family protein [Dermatophilaceae bacterium]
MSDGTLPAARAVLLGVGVSVAYALTAAADQRLAFVPACLTALLVICLPDSPVSRPRIVLAGYAAAVLLGPAVALLHLPTVVGMGLAAAAMVAIPALRLGIHPPATALALLLVLEGATYGDGFLAAAALALSLVLPVLGGWGLSRYTEAGSPRSAGDAGG